MSLAPGWTEHRAPSGQFYYYNAQTRESTYVRPTADAAQASASPAAKKKKEKPKLKEPIPGTDWLKVTTTEDNIFYSHPETKVSSWTVPEEIKAAVQDWEEGKRKAKQEEDRVKREAEKAAAAQQKADEELLRKEQEAEAQRVIEETRGIKRKSNGEADVEQAGDADASADVEPAKPDPPPKKKQKAQKVSALEDLDEDWQRQIAAEMAKEAEQSEGQPGEAADSASSAGAAASKTLTSEEGKAVFKAMLVEKSINPMAPWDNELPKFVTDPRYTAVKTNKERRDLFDDFCKEKIREQRAAKQSAEKVAKLDPAQAYRALLVDVVTSTRMHWEDFRRDHKKDTRFRSFGRDDREREKAFKGWLRELGERKRGDAKRAELKFEELLAERVPQQTVLEGAAWKDLRDQLKGEQRYEAVGSSSLREEIWTRWSHKVRDDVAAAAATGPADEERKARERKERQEASLRAREEQVRRDKDAIARDAGRSRLNLGREESEREYRTLLVDAVRDHTATWEAARPSLERDPRFEAPSLSPRDKRDLFQRHLTDLYDKRLSAAEAQFATHATSLASRYPDVSADLLRLPAVERLGVSERRVEDLFAAWQRRRNDAARRDFDSMLSESSFVDFWGRMRKEALRSKGNADKKLIGEEGVDEEDEEDGGEVDLREMAKGIDLGEVEAVLRNDQRWIAFDHVPEAREQWMRDYLENLAAPTATVYQKS